MAWDHTWRGSEWESSHEILFCDNCTVVHFFCFVSSIFFATSCSRSFIITAMFFFFFAYRKGRLFSRVLFFRAEKSVHKTSESALTSFCHFILFHRKCFRPDIPIARRWGHDPIFTGGFSSAKGARSTQHASPSTDEHRYLRAVRAAIYAAHRWGFNNDALTLYLSIEPRDMAWPKIFSFNDQLRIDPWRRYMYLR